MSPIPTLVDVLPMYLPAEVCAKIRMDHLMPMTTMEANLSRRKAFSEWKEKGNVAIREAASAPVTSGTSDTTLYTHTIIAEPTIVKYKMVGSDVKYMDIFHDGMDVHFKVQCRPDVIFVHAFALYDHADFSSEAWHDAMRTLILVLQRLLPRATDPSRIHAHASCLQTIGRWRGLLLKEMVWPMVFRKGRTAA